MQPYGCLALRTQTQTVGCAMSVVQQQLGAYSYVVCSVRIRVRPHVLYMQYGRALTQLYYVHTCMQPLRCYLRRIEKKEARLSPPAHRRKSEILRPAALHPI
eukprot:COSAG01_NODE_2459_length_7655_cov_138.985442_8_plen_102_part_00